MRHTRKYEPKGQDGALRATEALRRVAAPISLFGDPNDPVHQPGPLQRRGVARIKNAAPAVVQRLDRRCAPPGTVRLHPLRPADAAVA